MQAERRDIFFNQGYRPWAERDGWVLVVPRGTRCVIAFAAVALTRGQGQALMAAGSAAVDFEGSW